MINEETMTFIINNKQGQKKEYTILFSFVSEKTNKHYLVYTDNTLDENGSLNIEASIIDEKSETFLPITSKEEIDLVSQKAEEYRKELLKTQ